MSEILIDYTYSSGYNKPQNSGIIYAATTDHFPVFSAFSLQCGSTPCQPVIINSVNEQSMVRYKEKLITLLWHYFPIKTSSR